MEELEGSGKTGPAVPKQVIDLGKLAWKWAIERVDGRAWVYFIFLVCDWLPTNLRRNKHSDMKRTVCHLCQCAATEDMLHVFTCPALRKEQNDFREQVNAVFRKWDLPYGNIGNYPQQTFCKHGQMRYRGDLRKNIMRSSL